MAAPQLNVPGGRQTLDRNTSGTPAAPPVADSAPDSDLQANASHIAGAYVSNGSHLAKVPEEQQAVDEGTPVSYPAGSYQSNRVAGPKVPGLGI